MGGYLRCFVCPDYFWGTSKRSQPRAHAEEPLKKRVDITKNAGRIGLMVLELVLAKMGKGSRW